MGENEHSKYYENAERNFQDSIRLNPNYPQALVYLAKCKIIHSVKNNYRIKGAFDHLNKALTIYNENNKNIIDDDLFTTMGNLLLKSRDIEHSIIAFNKALELNKKNYDAFLGLGNCYILKNEYKLAMYYYDELIYNIDDKEKINRDKKQIAIEKKIKASYKAQMYEECLTDIGRLKYHTEKLDKVSESIRNICIAKLQVLSEA